jgi:hypothetical protein
MAKRYKIIVIIIVILISGFGVFVFMENGLWRLWQNEQFVATTTSTNVIKTEKATTTNLSLKTYRNEEWGFEFNYPSELSLKEKVFGGYYSKFNLVLFKHIGESRDWAIVVNIVLPKFVDNKFWKSQDDISKIVVDGIEGVRYNYVFQEFPHTDVIFPLGDMKMIIGTGEGSYIYLEELNQILSSFRFIK